VHPDRLAVALWGEELIPSARETTKSLVARLRRQLESSEAISLELGKYKLNPTIVTSDAAEFLRLSSTAGDAPSQATLESALGLWSGPQVLDDQEDHGEFVIERLALESIRVDLRASWVELVLASDHLDLALPTLWNEISQDPLREEWWLALAECLVRLGHRRSASQVLQRCRATLEGSGLAVDLSFEAREASILSLKTLRSGAGRRQAPGDAIETAGPAPPPKRIATADGSVLAYQVWGRGETTVLWIPGRWEHLLLDWEVPGLGSLFSRLGEQRRIVRFDPRGLALSGWGPIDLETRAADAVGVLNALGIESCPVIAMSEGGLVAAYLAANYPSLVEAVVFWGCYACKATHDPRRPEEVRSSLLASWGSGEFLTQVFEGSPETETTNARTEQMIGSPREVAARAAANAAIDVTPYLSEIKAPTLVLHDRQDPIVPYSEAQFLCRSIKDARLQSSGVGGHIGWAVDANTHVADRIDEFLSQIGI
jgi:pimeloyl-ACP methyl ester carboxylesterase/DNA-binding SARP family transcriptional activator